MLECDFCGGPAFWTLIDGATYFHCEEMCVEFRDQDIEPLRFVKRHRRIDKIVSVSASEGEDEELPW